MEGLLFPEDNEGMVFLVAAGVLPLAARFPVRRLQAAAQGIRLSPWPPHVGALVCANHRKAGRAAAAVLLSPGLPMHDGRVTVASPGNEHASETRAPALLPKPVFQGGIAIVQPTRARRVW